MKTITKFEYEPILESDVDNFTDLERFVLENNAHGADALELMSLSAKKGCGKMITPKNYVGVIKFKNGIEIEILPKIGKIINEAATRRIFMRMLKSVYDLPFKEFDVAELDSNKISPFEFFVRMYIDTVFKLIKTGLCCAYYDVEGNETFLKGKLNFTQDIRFNAAHRERFFIEHQLFGENRSENRLIKSTSEYLYRMTSNDRNKKDLNIVLSQLELVESSSDIEADFDTVCIDRGMKLYVDVIKWCDLFLHNKSFTTFSGCNIAYSFLFPMDKLYEAYVAKFIKRILGKTQDVLIQDRSTHLFDDRCGPKIRPDVMIKSKDKTIIIDTKWKLLDSVNDVSVSDLYQMYVYSVKYNAEETILLYPKFGGAEESYSDSINSVNVSVRFVDMYDLENSLADIAMLLSAEF